MSILQEYESIAQKNNKRWKEVDYFLHNNPQYLLSDVLYDVTAFNAFEQWIALNPLPNGYVIH